MGNFPLFHNVIQSNRQQMHVYVEKGFKIQIGRTLHISLITKNFWFIVINELPTVIGFETPRIFANSFDAEHRTRLCAFSICFPSTRNVTSQCCGFCNILYQSFPKVDVSISIFGANPVKKSMYIMLKRLFVPSTAYQTY